MAIQMAVPSHGGETFVTLIKDADEKFCGPASNFLGLKCDGAGNTVWADISENIAIYNIKVAPLLTKSKTGKASGVARMLCLLQYQSWSN